jgi:ubiquinone/menaquinone biosynthesis C-methylase UbiE/NAD-dependent dihydropyrimidine dehydrogenase PreA subunit
MFSYIYMKILESAPQRYDKGINLLSLGQADRTIDTIVSSYIREGMKILDIGCGTGTLAIKAAEKGAEVVGIDISGEMLSVAGEKVHAQGLEEAVELVNIGVLEMDDRFDEGSFDCVVSTLVFSELSRDERAFALRECRRILKDDGTLVIADETRPGDSVREALYYLVRAPLSLATYAFAQTATKAVPDLEGLLWASGFKVEESRMSMLDAFTLVVGSKGEEPPAYHGALEARVPEWRKALEPVVENLFRWFPFPVETGLRRVGEPDRDSPVLVTCNYSLTEKRLRKGLGDLDCYLVLAPTKGINNWCSSAGGIFSAHGVYSAVKASRIGDLVEHRRLVLPQLSAPGVNKKEVSKLTGWKARFGPVFAEDIPAYIENDYRKAPHMHIYEFKPEARLDLVVSMNFQYYLGAMIYLALFRRRKIAGFSALFWSLTFTDYLFFDRLPTRYGWTKALVNGGFFSLAIAAYHRLAGRDSKDTWKSVAVCMGISAMLGMDLAGITGVLRDEPLMLLYKLGIKKLGPFTVHPMEEPSLDEEKCIGCGSCYDVCPRGVYVIDEREKKSRVTDIEACEMCRACVEQCPEGAITIIDVRH